MQALTSWLVRQGRQTTVYRDWSNGQDPDFLRNFELSPAVLKLRGHAAKAETFLRRQSMPARASKNVKDQIDILHGRLPIDPLGRCITVCATAILSAFLMSWAIVNVSLLQANASIVLATAATIRNANIVLALLRYRYISGRLVWKFLEDRLIPAAPSLIAYSVPAFSNRYRYLYGSEWYTFVVAAILVIWLCLISFSSWTRVAYEQALTRRKLSLTNEDKDEAFTLLDAFENALSNVYPLLDDPTISDRLRHLMNFLKADCNDLVEQLRLCCGRAEPARQNKVKYALAPKLPVWLFGVAIIASNIAAFIQQPILLAERSAFGSWVIARLGHCCFSWRQSSRNMLDLFSSIASGAALALVTVILPMIASRGAVLNGRRNIAMLTCIHTLATLLFARSVGPFLLWLIDQPAIFLAWVKRCRRRAHKPDEPDVLSYTIDWEPPPRSPIILARDSDSAHNDDALPPFPELPNWQIDAHRNSVVSSTLWSAVINPANPGDGVSKAVLAAVEMACPRFAGHFSY